MHRACPAHRRESSRIEFRILPGGIVRSPQFGIPHRELISIRPFPTRCWSSEQSDTIEVVLERPQVLTLVIPEQIVFSVDRPNLEKRRLRRAPLVLDSHNLEDVFVQNELTRTFVRLIAGVGVDIDLKGHERILFHPVETFCEEFPIEDNSRQRRLRID